ncbi:Uncharacterised protein [Mycobacteroides abscessus]|nr:Uncharacterised protein [Mycobacteroides abscessus]
MLNQTFCFFNHHFSNLNVTCRRFIKGRSHDFTANRTFHLGHFFWTFINQENDQNNFRIIANDGLCNALQQHGFTRFRRSHNN